MYAPTPNPLPSCQCQDFYVYCWRNNEHNCEYIWFHNLNVLSMYNKTNNCSDSEDVRIGDFNFCNLLASLPRLFHLLLCRPQYYEEMVISLSKYMITRSLGALRPWAPTSSFGPFGRSGRVTHDWCAFALDGDLSVTHHQE